MTSRNTLPKTQFSNIPMTITYQNCFGSSFGGIDGVRWLMRTRMRGGMYGWVGKGKGRKRRWDGRGVVSGICDFNLLDADLVYCRDGRKWW